MAQQQKPNSRNNGRRQNNRNSERKPNDQQSFEPRKSSVYEALKFDASNIYFNNLLGTPLLDGLAVPGILTLDGFPNYVSRSDMINVAATSIYTYVRHANSGRSNYESSDYMQYLISMSEVYTALTDVIRVFGIAQFFDSRNLYSGHLISALGYDPIQLRSNLGDIRYAINSLINKIKAFAVPQVFNYFEERVSEFASVYKDADSPFAQYIVKRNMILGEFNPLTEGGGSIVFQEIHSKKLDIFEYIKYLNKVVDDLRANEDINIMSGDTLKAYGSELFNLEPVTADTILEPVYDPLFLAQLQNAHISDDVTVAPLKQENNRLISRTDIEGITSISEDNKPRILNSESADVDANLIFALSKYQVTCDANDILVSGNTTILANMQIWTRNDDEFQVHTLTQIVEVIDSFEELMGITKFSLHPYIYINDNVMKSLPLGDMEHVARLSPEDTNRMNDARFILSFQTKQMG